MKDPLQTEATPYEILVLGPGAGRKEINSAFKRVFESRKEKNLQKLTKAKNILLDQEKRLLLDFLHYESSALNRLARNPLNDIAVLNPNNRSETAAAWENQLKNSLSDIGIVHSLCVLWYWWAMYEESLLSERIDANNTENKDFSSVPALELMWERVIAYWVTFIRNIDAWGGTKKISNTLKAKLGQTLEQLLRNRFNELGQRRQGDETGPLKELYRGLNLELTTELYTSKEIQRLGFKIQGNNILCGRLMLDRAGFLNQVKDQVSKGLMGGDSNSDALLRLNTALSAHHSIAILVDNRPEDALKAIEGLSADDQESFEIGELKARAFMELGRQKADLGYAADALDAWEKALEIDQNNTFTDKIRTLIVSTCLDEAANLKRYQQEEAIKFLESGLNLVDDEKLRLSLSDLYTLRGIKTFTDAQKEIEKRNGSVTSELISALEKGLADMKRAEEMGSKRAAEQAERAENYLNGAKHGFLNISDQTRKVVSQADKAAERKEWKEAIGLLREFLKTLKGTEQVIIKKRLAQYLNARAVENINASMTKHHEAVQAEQDHLSKRVQDYLRTGIDPKIKAALDAARDSKKFNLTLFVEDVCDTIARGWFIAIIVFSDILNRGFNWLGGIFLAIYAIALLTRGLMWLIEYASKLYKSVIYDRPLWVARDPYDNRPRCDLCKNGAYYRFEFPGYGRYSLCDSHAKKLRAIMKDERNKIDPKILRPLESAALDLEEAAGYDPSNQDVKRNLIDLKKIFTQFDIPIPSKKSTVKTRMVGQGKDTKTGVKQSKQKNRLKSKSIGSAYNNRTRSFFRFLVLAIAYLCYFIIGIVVIFQILHHYNYSLDLLYKIVLDYISNLLASIDIDFTSQPWDKRIALIIVIATWILYTFIIWKILDFSRFCYIRILRKLHDKGPRFTRADKFVIFSILLASAIVSFYVAEDPIVFGMYGKIVAYVGAIMQLMENAIFSAI